MLDIISKEADDATTSFKEAVWSDAANGTILGCNLHAYLPTIP